MSTSSTAVAVGAAAAAGRAAAAVAAGADLTVRELADPAEYLAAERLLIAVWRSEQPPLGAELMRALEHAGGYVGGAYHDGTLVGVCAGFVGQPADPAEAPQLHSHITGVVPGAQRRGAGLALKLHQRAWALARGLDTITWTYDPLVRRNAFFNLVKLAGRASEYLVDFYGPMRDGINAGQGSDRVLVTWSLTAPAVVRAATGDVAEPGLDGTVVLRVGPDGAPRREEPAGAATLLCAVPEDIEGVRRADPGLARAWRDGVREALGGAMSRGYRVAGLARSGWYVLTTGGTP